MKRKTLFLPSLFSLFLVIVSCATIEISERDAFDAHRTVTPETFNIEPYRLHDVTLQTEDGEELDAWFLERDDAQATVVYYGGNGFLMVISRSLIEAYREVPVNIMLFDYRGYGRSSGTASVRGLKTDARVAYNYARNGAPSPQETIIVHGHSMGSFLAAMIADENEVAGYILEGPITEVNRWTRRLVPWIARPFVRFRIDQPIQEQNNLERVSRIYAPVLITGGAFDDITPFRMAAELYEASASTQKRLVEVNGAKHNDLPRFRQYREALATFYAGLGIE
ncbi:MAG: alpha/beta fold hydrolase [Balneolaceae bacterium]|nr:MAG: alpha/beta fold hydrolase [Balneolaceae bacterium]